MAHLHDVAIMGATPAGLAAAYCLAKGGADVVVVDSPASNASCPLADWTSADLFALPRLPPGLARLCGAKPFKTIVYHGVTLDRTAEHHSRGVLGYFLRTPDLTAALAAQAKKAGARFRQAKSAPAPRLDDECVVLRNGRSLTARLLIVTDGQPADALADIGIMTRTSRPQPLMAAGLDMPWTGRSDGALHVVEEPEQTEIGMYFVTGRRLHLRVISSSSAAGTRAAELSGLLARLQAHGELPPRLALHRARGAVWYPPAGMALDLETHTAKRCMLAGVAGGFVEPVIGGTLYASIASALLAAQAAAKALAAAEPGPAIEGYRAAWRKVLEKRLLRPGTPFRVLLPLVFANPKVTSRLTASLLRAQEGED